MRIIYSNFGIILVKHFCIGLLARYFEIKKKKKKKKTMRSDEDFIFVTAASILLFGLPERESQLSFSVADQKLALSGHSVKIGIFR